MVVPEVDPLSPENVFVFTFGPLTGTILDANSGGFQGMQFKKTGQIVSVDGGLPEAFLRQMIRSVN